MVLGEATNYLLSPLRQDCAGPKQGSAVTPLLAGIVTGHGDFSRAFMNFGCTCEYQRGKD